MFLACAADDAPSLTPVVRQLVRRGVRIDVVSGVDLDTRPLEQALARTTSRSLWVLCRSDDLDSFQIELLRATLEETSVPSQRILETPFNVKAPTAFVGAVSRRLRDAGFLQASTSVSPPPPPPASRLPDSVAHERAVAAPKRQSTGPLLCPPELDLAAPGSTMVAPCPSRWPRWTTRVGAAIGLAVTAMVVLATTLDRDPPARVDPMVDEVPVAHVDVPVPPSVVVTSPVVAPPVARETPRSRSVELEASFREGRIRGIDLLLLTHPSRKQQTRAVAEKTCAQVTEGGLDGWRLATREELATIARSGFVSKYTLWWTAEDSARAMWTGTRTLAKPSTPRTRAKVVCVTDRPR